MPTPLNAELGAGNEVIDDPQDGRDITDAVPTTAGRRVSLVEPALAKVARQDRQVGSSRVEEVRAERRRLEGQSEEAGRQRRLRMRYLV